MQKNNDRYEHLIEFHWFVLHNKYDDKFRSMLRSAIQEYLKHVKEESEKVRCGET